MGAAEQRAFEWYDPRSARGRLGAGLLLGVGAALLVPAAAGPAVRLVAGWDAAGLGLLASCCWIIVRSDAAETRRRAGSEDPGRHAIWLLVVLGGLFSLGASAFVLRRSRDLAPGASGALVALCLGAVAVSWALTHAAYTLRYAHLYYRGSAGSGGLQFPNGEAPDDLDFAYFSFTIGMCFQTSDVTVSSRPLRRAVLAHALVSFIYNTVVLALTLNLFAGIFH